MVTLYTITFYTEYLFLQSHQLKVFEYGLVQYRKSGFFSPNLFSIANRQVCYRRVIPDTLKLKVELHLYIYSNFDLVSPSKFGINSEISSLPQHLQSFKTEFLSLNIVNVQMSLK